ncbi:MAG: hypothetical protein JXB50_01285 [Spirochaetes bacterium]|nr:hypothetical protein [Spirochaetota bacterium]
MKKFVLLFSVLLMIVSCKTTIIKDKKTQGNILFKKLLSDSVKVESAYISGLLKITGVKDIPSAFIKFESQTLFNEKKSIFKIKVLNKVSMDIFIDKTDVYIINNINKQFVKISVEKADLSSITGMNFNLIDLSYFFLGFMPNSDTMEMTDFNVVKNQYIMKITDNISKYIISLNKNIEFINVKIENQYYDTITLESIIYAIYDDGTSKPKYITFSQEEKKVKIFFILNGNKMNYIKEGIFNYDFFNDYKIVNTFDELKPNLKN